MPTMAQSIDRAINGRRGSAASFANGMQRVASRRASAQDIQTARSGGKSLDALKRDVDKARTVAGSARIENRAKRQAQYESLQSQYNARRSNINAIVNRNAETRATYVGQRGVRGRV